jgi:hypothetical protein
MTRRDLVMPILVGVSALHAASAFAQAETRAKANGSEPVKIVTLDLAVPDSPAFAILGLSPESIVRPSSPRELATTVLNGLDRNGNLQSGLAVDLAPRFLFAGNSLTYAQYSAPKARVTRLSARTQLSFATSKGASDDDKSLRTALGLRTTLWDRGDPRLDGTLVGCLDTVRVQPPNVALSDTIGQQAFEAAQTKAIQPLVEGCHQDFKNRRWNASSLAAGIAPSWQSPSGASQDFKYSGAAFWTSLAIELNSARNHAVGQLIVQGRYRNKELVKAGEDSKELVEQDSTGVGTRLLLGAPSRAAVLEGELIRKSPDGKDADTSFTLSGGGQLKLANDLWLSLAVGGSLGASEVPKRLFVLSSFKWALSREPAAKLPTP